MSKKNAFALDLNWWTDNKSISIRNFILQPATFAKVYELALKNKFAPLKFRNLRNLTELLGFNPASGKQRKVVSDFFAWYEGNISQASFFYRQTGHLHFSPLLKLYFEKYHAFYKAISSFNKYEFFSLKLFHIFLSHQPMGGIELSLKLDDLMEEVSGTENKSYFKRVLKRNLEILMDKNLIHSWELDEANKLLKVDVVFQGEKLRLVKTA